jgi:NADPH:quinone reductase-like Zn-dependent oxidoreductase
MERSMKAALFHEHGGPEVVRLEDVPTPSPEAGEVRLLVEAAALNHLDLWVRAGLPIETPMPHIGGSDVCGTVDAVGEGVDQGLLGGRFVVDPSIACGRCPWCALGEAPLCVRYRILGEHTQGAFAEYVTVPAANLWGIPVDYPAVAAAAAPLAFLTAWRALVTRARLAAGDSVLITGASGGVSTAAIQIARHLDATVYAVTSSPHVEEVRALGAHVVYDRTAEDFSRAVWRDTGKRGVDVVLDSVGQAVWEGCVRSLARGGRMVSYGATTGPRAATDIRLLFWKQLEILGSTMSNRVEFEAAMHAVFHGPLRPVVARSFPLSEARLAHEQLEAGAVFGKLVLVPDPLWNPGA